MRRRFLLAAVLSLALLVSSVGVFPAAATTHKAAGTHKLIVAVKRTLDRAAEKKLFILVLISQNGGAPAAALATSSKPLVILQADSGLYRMKVEIDASCRGACTATGRISGSANHKLEVIPHCRLNGSGFVCSKLKIVRMY